ncbi:uncharacterized protein LOC118192290 [Stegodyphus dumicola]|uniref:uncharacterized protein LOC118192290 n=1 Tax=Stegodyphus dumicola TaxID=202533 RepID=UPI0015B31B98|nr:uncharacterized protein LOC118192290 [Stegodyphus dumicola]
MNFYVLILFASIAFSSTTYADHVEHTHLVTMRKAELMKIVDCISKSKDPVLCEKFVMCEKMMPKQILLALEMCQKKCIMGGIKRCNHYEPLFTTPEIPVKIFECVVENTHMLNPEEKKMMVEFEKCTRELYDEGCKMPKMTAYYV